MEIQIDWGADDELGAATLTGYIYCVVGSVTSDITTFTNALSPNWVSNVVGGATNFLGLSQEDFTAETNLDVYVYFIGTAEAMSIALDAISLRVHYQTEKDFGIDAQGRFAIVDTNDAVRYPLIELDTLSNQVAAIEGTDTNSFIAVSNRVDGLMDQTDTWNTASTDASSATGNVAVLQGDFTAHTNNETADILHFTAAEKAIATNAVQQGADGTSTNLSDYNNDAGFVTNAPTNQIIVVDGTAYTITNAPASAGDVLVFDPASTTAYFAAQSGGGLTEAQVKNVAPLMTNSDNIIVGKNASGNSYGVALGSTASASSFGAAVGQGANGATYGVGIGANANGGTYGVSIGYLSLGASHGAAIGRKANGQNYSFAGGAYSSAISNSVAVGAYVTNPVTGTTRVRGDLYLDGGNRIYVRSAFNSGSFSEYGNSPFQEFSSSVEAVDGTATVVYASGNLVRIEATNNTEITFDNTDFPTNGVNRVWIELLAGAHTITFNESTITNAVAPTPSTENWTSLEFRRTTTNLWRGVQY